MQKINRSTSISESSFWRYLSRVMLALLFGNVACGCALSFSCRAFLPTLSFLGSFRDHDRMFMLALTLYAVFLPVLCFSVYLKTRKAMSWVSKASFLFLGLASSPLLVLVGFIDQVNGLYFFLIEYRHYEISLILFVSLTLWVYLALDVLEKVTKDETERSKLNICWKIYRFELFMGFLTMFEWHFAYTIYSNVLMNEVVEALVEWVFIGTAVVYPYYLAKVNEFSVTLRWPSTKI
mmetsp:Transcript_12244/g.17832  ORF Transcript_12244/g.17832 Transcript_12244/m.17832 type:complete len:236 (-) Transcript_12244:31-738(-)